MAGEHDQRFKGLLRYFLPAFTAGFFPPEWAGLCDTRSAEWLEQEVHLDPPDGETRRVDLVARLSCLVPAEGVGDPDHRLAHLEVESGSAAGLRHRAFEYHHALRRRYRAEVLTVALYLNAVMAGAGWDEFEIRTGGVVTTTQRYWYVALRGLDAEAHATADNPLAVALAAWMRVAPGRREGLKGDILGRLAGFELDNLGRFLLVEVVHKALPLTADEWRDAVNPLTQDEVRMFARITGSLPEMIAEADALRAEADSLRAEADARAAEERATARLATRTALTLKFGPLPRGIEARIDDLSREAIRELLERAPSAASLDELFPPEPPKPARKRRRPG